ncbi:MAG: hypothetical protein RJB13_2468, partial [Pseudomonadota bacterium]
MRLVFLHLKERVSNQKVINNDPSGKSSESSNRRGAFNAMMSFDVAIIGG